MLRVRAKSRYDELWRYNLIMSCAGIDTQAQTLYVEGAKRIVSEEFFPAKDVMLLVPADFVVGEPLDIECGEAANLRILLYVIPYIFPDETRIDARKPFELSVEIFEGTELLCERLFDVNCWSGTSLDFTINIEDERVSK